MVHLPLLLAAAASLAALVAPATAATAAPATTLTLNTGQEMPFINLGGTAQAVVPGNHYSNYSEFLHQGGRGLDTALIYTDPINKQIAAALKAHPEIPRSELFITSKVPCPVANKNPEYSCADAADCMKRNNALLQLPWTDLTLVHEPCATPEETIARWVQMEAALAAGLTKAIGVSNFNAELLATMLGDKRVKIVPAVNQCNHAIANHNESHGASHGGDDKTVQFCQSHGIAYSAYSPLEGLGGGSVMKIPEVIDIGKSHSVSAAQVAFRWLIQQNITAVTAAHVPAYITEDLDVFSFTLSASEMARISAI